MAEKPPSFAVLSDLHTGQEADLFLLLAHKDEAKTRDGKSYCRVTFRDAGKQLTFPIWNDSPWADACRDQWRPGVFYKVRAVYRDTNFGPQLDIRKIRETTDDDRAEGFDPLSLLPKSRYDAGEMYAELLAIAQDRVAHAGLSALVQSILTKHRDVLCDLPAAIHHHNFRSGFLEHLLNVARNAVYLAERYGSAYPDHLPAVGQALVVAGAMLHDIGKLAEIRVTPSGAEFTPAGELIGHIVLGRDFVREAAVEHPLDAETLLRLEHIVISHQKTPEWGSPKPPMTLEALLVHYADDIDAKLQMMVEALPGDSSDGCVTSRRNALAQKVFRGLPPEGA
jgi:3'-5' exoribonuclease